jgi:hypothetical protein
VRAGAPSSSPNLLVIDGSSAHDENDGLIDTIKITEIKQRAFIIILSTRKQYKEKHRPERTNQVAIRLQIFTKRFILAINPAGNPC